MQKLHLSAPNRNCLRPRIQATVPRHRFVCRSLCPYETLGLPATANDAEVKKAFRKLALQYHPDVCKNEDAHASFLAIQQAYDILSGKARGKDIPTTQADWEWHDWYWNFCRSRNWRRNAAGKPAIEDTPSVKPNFDSSHSKENLRTQLAGLRHRAAIRAQKTRQSRSFHRTSSEASSATSETQETSCSSDFDVTNTEHNGAEPSCSGVNTLNTEQEACCQAGEHLHTPTSQAADNDRLHSPSAPSTDSDKANNSRSKRVVPGVNGNSRVLEQLAGLKRKAAFARGL